MRRRDREDRGCQLKEHGAALDRDQAFEGTCPTCGQTYLTEAAQLGLHAISALEILAGENPDLKSLMPGIGIVKMSITQAIKGETHAPGQNSPQDPPEGT